MESQFLKKHHILTNVTDFLASENHFLPFFQAAVKMEENGSRKWKKMVSTSQKISSRYLTYHLSLMIGLQ